jgi:hypothetical protein
MHYLLGIDDTDNLESRGTGRRVRQLGDWLAANQLSVPLGITRHQQWGRPTNSLYFPLQFSYFICKGE